MSVSHANGDSDVRALEMLRAGQDSLSYKILDQDEDECAFMTALNTTCRLSAEWFMTDHLGSVNAGEDDGAHSSDDDLEDSDDDDDEGRDAFNLTGLKLVGGWEAMQIDSDRSMAPTPKGGKPSRGSILFSDFTSTSGPRKGASLSLQSLGVEAIARVEENVFT